MSDLDVLKEIEKYLAKGKNPFEIIVVNDCSFDKTKDEIMLDIVMLFFDIFLFFRKSKREMNIKIGAAE